jgi:hypothetical protein
MIYATLTHNNLDSLWLKCWYSPLYFLQPDWRPHYHPRFPKLQTCLEFDMILVFNFHIIYLLCRLLIDSLSIVVPRKDRIWSILECRLVSIKMWSVWLCVIRSGEVKVYSWILRCWKILLLTDFFDVANFTTLTSLLLLLYVNSFSIAGLKVFPIF